MTTKEIYELLKTETYCDHTTFGGNITDYHFNGYTSMCSVASDIASDKRFDKSCKINRENINRKKFK